MRLPQRVLFVGAHCDDIELLAGGLLSLTLRTEREVGVMVFSDHRGVTSDAAAEQAHREFRENMAWLAERTGRDVTDHSGEMMPACQGVFQAERGRIYSQLEALVAHYDLVVTHPASDTNQDHQQVAAEVVRVFKAHATVLGGEFPSNDLGRFRSQVLVPLEEADLDAKVRMVRAYVSQRFGGRPYFEAAAVRGLAAVRGSQIRAAAAEAFEVMGRVIVR